MNDFWPPLLWGGLFFTIFSLSSSPAAPLAVLSSLSGKPLPVCTGSNTGSLEPRFSGLLPESPDLQADGTASGTLVTPDLSVP